MLEVLDKGFITRTIIATACGEFLSTLHTFTVLIPATVGVKFIFDPCAIGGELEGQRS